MEHIQFDGYLWPTKWLFVVVVKSIHALFGRWTSTLWLILNVCILFWYFRTLQDLGRDPLAQFSAGPFCYQGKVTSFLPFNLVLQDYFGWRVLLSAEVRLFMNDFHFHYNVFSLVHPVATHELKSCKCLTHLSLTRRALQSCRLTLFQNGCKVI